jgi:hypothetical protein
MTFIKSLYLFFQDLRRKTRIANHSSKFLFYSRSCCSMDWCNCLQNKKAINFSTWNGVLSDLKILWNTNFSFLLFSQELGFELEYSLRNRFSHTFLLYSWFEYRLKDCTSYRLGLVVCRAFFLLYSSFWRDQKIYCQKIPEFIFRQRITRIKIIKNYLWII